MQESFSSLLEERLWHELISAAWAR